MTPSADMSIFEITVTFEDGRKGLLEGDVQIADMPRELPGGMLREAAE